MRLARGRTQPAPSPTAESSGDILYDNHLRPPPASSGETKGPYCPLGVLRPIHLLFT